MVKIIKSKALLGLWIWVEQKPFQAPWKSTTILKRESRTLNEHLWYLLIMEQHLLNSRRPLVHWSCSRIPRPKPYLETLTLVLESWKLMETWKLEPCHPLHWTRSSTSTNMMLEVVPTTWRLRLTSKVLWRFRSWSQQMSEAKISTILLLMLLNWRATQVRTWHEISM